MKRIFSFLISIIILSFLSVNVFAFHKEDILGESTNASTFDFPPVTSGPGLILPDSPFYFLDNLKQSIKLALAMGPRSKSILHKQIAGERLAELRVMMARGNKTGIQTALLALTHEMNMAVKEMNDAKSKGKDIKKLTQELNEALKIQKQTLAEVSAQSKGSIALSIQATLQALQEAKSEVEHNLSESEFDNEIADLAMDEMDATVLGIENAKLRLEKASEIITKQSSKAAERRVMEKRKKLEEVRKSGNREFIRVAQEDLLKEERDQEELLRNQKNAIEKSKNAFLKAIEATSAYKNAKSIFLKLRTGE